MQRITAAKMLSNVQLADIVHVTTVAVRMCVIGSVPTLWQSGLIHCVLLMHMFMRWAEAAHNAQERRPRVKMACDTVERVVRYIAESHAGPAATEVDHAEAIIGSQVPAWRMSMVWPLHKRVCGPRANPFLRPVLSQKEADEAVANIDNRIDDPDVPDFPSLREYFSTVVQVLGNIAPQVIRSLQDEEPINGLERKHKQSLLQEVRFIEMQRLNDLQRDIGGHLTDVMHLASMASKRFVAPGVEPDTWQSGLLHCILLLQQLLRWAPYGPQHKPVARQHLAGAVDRIERYVRDPPDDMEAAKVRAARATVEKQVPTWRMLVAGLAASRS
ncbi:hypothetical protein JCM10449v2_003525 [Rhodotorula kratochvilovae]